MILLSRKLILWLEILLPNTLLQEERGYKYCEERPKRNIMPLHLKLRSLNFGFTALEFTTMGSRIAHIKDERGGMELLTAN